MAWMFQQRGRLLLAIRLSPAAPTHVGTVNAHTCARACERVSPSVLVFVALNRVTLHMLFSTYAYKWNACGRSCVEVFFCERARVFTYTLTPSVVIRGIVSCIMKDKPPRRGD